MKEKIELLILVLVLAIFPMGLLFLATHQQNFVSGIEKILK